MRRETQAGVLSAAELDLGSENRPRSETQGGVNGNKRGKTQGGLTFIGSLSRPTVARRLQRRPGLLYLELTKVPYYLAAPGTPPAPRRGQPLLSVCLRAPVHTPPTHLSRSLPLSLDM